MFEVFLVSIKATMKVVVICVGGAYLERASIFNSAIRKGVSEAFVKLLLPCLLFTQILPSMSLEMLPIMAWLAFGNLMYVSVGFLVGAISVRLTQPELRLQTVLKLVPAIGHGNSIPFMLVTMLCSDYAGFEERDAEKAQGFVGLYLVMHSITLWGIGLNVIKKEKDDEQPKIFNNTSELKPSVSSEGGIGTDPLPTPVDFSREAEVIGRSLGNGPNAECPREGDNIEFESHITSCADFEKSVSLKGTFCFAVQQILGLPSFGQFPSRSDSSSMKPSSAPPSATAISEIKEGAWADSVSSLETGVVPVPQFGKQFICKPPSLKGLVPQWLNRPVMAALTAAVLGLYPPIKLFFLTQGNFVYGAMEKIGETGPPLSLLTVGALFVADGVPTPSTIGYAPLAGVVLSRLVVLPLCCISLWEMIRWTVPFFPTDRVFILVVFLECITPTAYNLVTMCVLQGRGAKELAAALFYQNIIAIFTMTAWVTVILYFLI